MKSYKEVFMGRKFLAVMFGLATSFILALLDKLTVHYATVVSVSVAAFNVADMGITRAVMKYRQEPEDEEGVV